MEKNISFFIFNLLPCHFLGPFLAELWRRMNALHRQLTLSKAPIHFPSPFTPKGNCHISKHRSFHPNKGGGGGGIEILLKNNRTGRQKSRSGAKAQLESEWQRGPPHLVPYSSLMEALCHLLVQVTKGKAVVRSDCLIIYCRRKWASLKCTSTCLGERLPTLA